MGKMQRVKGRAFEQEIARRFRGMDCIVRRSLQAHCPWEPDVVVTHADPESKVHRLWVECNHANDPNPEKKLAQAIRDIGNAVLHEKRDRWWPWVVWRETGRRQVLVTTTSWCLLAMATSGTIEAVLDKSRHLYPVTTPFYYACEYIGLTPGLEP